jgi:hypothetical protein
MVDTVVFETDLCLQLALLVSLPMDILIEIEGFFV